jgi:hypothetical protein
MFVPLISEKIVIFVKKRKKTEMYIRGIDELFSSYEAYVSSSAIFPHDSLNKTENPFSH